MAVVNDDGNCVIFFRREYTLDISDFGRNSYELKDYVSYHFGSLAIAQRR